MQCEKYNFLVLLAINLDGYLIDDTTMVEEDEVKFKVAWDRDQMIVPFQCDICYFLNIRQRFPAIGNYTDELLLLCIGRVILDRMWTR